MLYNYLTFDLSRLDWLRSFGSESEGVSLRKKIPAAVVHVSEDVVDQLHSLRSVVEDARLASRVEAVGDQLDRSVVRFGLVDSDLFFWFYRFVFKEKYNILNILSKTMAEASKEISVFWRTYSRFSTLSRVIWWKATSPVGKR